MAVILNLEQQPTHTSHSDLERKNENKTNEIVSNPMRAVLCKKFQKPMKIRKFINHADTPTCEISSVVYCLIEADINNEMSS